MPEEESSGTDLDRILDNLDDFTLNVHNYQSIQNALDAETSIRIPVVEKLLSICSRDLKDMKHLVELLNILGTILKKVKTMQFTLLPDLVPSAIAVLHVLKSTALFNKVESLNTLCFEIIRCYPDETLIAISVNHSTEIMELLNLYCHQQIPVVIRLQAINIIIKLLNILPPDKKANFVKKGVNIWFSKMTSANLALPQFVDALELLTDELVHIDYTENAQWKTVLEGIYTPQKYPDLMKQLLVSGNENWHRLWIILIKLLKNQITKSNNTVGSPINSMLPVVEMAFKMDVANRCKAFTCWNVLIDNFATETNEVYINKRIKLLIIPLMSNNAKLESTAIAKLKTWWHLISRFSLRMDKFSDIILMPFLHFCFGKPVLPDKPILIPGMISEGTKVQAVQAFINIMGHTHCDGCVTLPKLKEKLLSTKLLVSHWRDWIHALNNVLQICKETNEFNDQQMKCFWKSFIMTIGELPENNIRRDLFNEVLGLLGKLAEGCNKKLSKIILNILIINLFDKDEKITPLLKSKDEQNVPIHKIVTIILKLPIYNLEERQTATQDLKVLSTYLIEEAVKTSSHTVEFILKYLEPNGLLFWTALADTTSELLYKLCPRILYTMLMWPFKIVDDFVNQKTATLAWFKLYKHASPILHAKNINKDIMETLEAHKSNTITDLFILNVAIRMLHQKLEIEDSSEFVKEADFLLKNVNKINKYDEIISICPSLREAVVLMLNSLCKNTNIAAAECAVSIISTILKLCKEISKDLDTEENALKNLESIFKILKVILKMETYLKLKSVLLNPLKDCAPYLKKHQTLKECILAIYKNANDIDNIKCNVQEVIDAFESDDKSNVDTESVTLNQCSDKVAFTTPCTKSIAKKQRKKDANIVNTVVENGEEFVVVKSNWKFNPRKLTDNQKEKLQRKREDIPALYQDLSQSQDEFKLTTWKTDSQDTTTTTSKSDSPQGNADVSTILKNIPSSDFVPKVLLENLMGKDKAETDQMITPAKENTKLEASKEENKKDETTNKLQITIKETKSPRLALKDRVFRNVRNLIEKSNLSNDNKESNSNLTENILKTPPIKVKTTGNLTNSAPSLISADRPSRLKRKPKKFDDLEVFGLKKRRHSSGQNDCPIDDEVIQSNTTQTDILNEHTKKHELHIENEEKSKEISNPDIQNIEEPHDPDIERNINETDNPTHNNFNEDTSSIPILDKSIDTEILQNEEKEGKVEKSNLTTEKSIETSCDYDSKDKNLSDSKIVDKNKSTDVQKSAKKSSTKKSRIEKELAIDMVEGHPFLKVQSEKRLTRKAILNSPRTRKSLSEKIKPDNKTPKTEKKAKERDRSITIKETQNTNEDNLISQDVIESSQESTLTTISIKSKSGKKTSIDNNKHDNESDTQSLLENISNDNNITSISTKDDTELPINKTVGEKVLIDLTENMDTEPINMDDDVIIINDDEDQSTVPINTENKIVDKSTQNTAEADTESIDPYTFVNEEEKTKSVKGVPDDSLESSALIETSPESIVDSDVTNASFAATSNEETKTMSESVLSIAEKEDLNSPFKDEDQRKKDFLNNTLEISPIKTLSPMREKKSPSPETSSDYVVIKLTSPVQSNGEPLEKIESPEFFTEERVSPDRRDQSPPREEVNVTNTSPSSSLSLKKNRPQVRPGGRAAQMLGLCVPDRLQTIMISDKLSDADETKKSPSLNTSARRNLRILYNSSTGEAQDISEEHEDSDNFLKLKRNLPATDCSPSGPILKRKLVDIADEITASPASKRKRVSFHDPPVSTTICVKKYIESGGVRSPQNSAIKRQERQLRSQLTMKSPKRLENVFKLDSVLTKAVESFTEANVATSEDTEMSSIEQTPIAQVIETTDLNDTDPICAKLVDCKDPISNIASELSSPTMKVLLIKEFEGKIDTVGDLAKLTELEINRLCIKSPKVEVAHKVLEEYLKKINKCNEEIALTNEAVMNDDVTENKSVEMETRKVVVENIKMQRDEIALSTDSTQTDTVSTIHCSAQTNESGSKTTAEIVTACLSERTDFVENLCEKMDEETKRKIVDNLPFNALTEMLLKKLTISNSDSVFDKVIEQKIKLDTQNDDNKDRRLSIVQEYLCKRFESKDLVLFCSELLKKVFDNF